MKKIIVQILVLFFFINCALGQDTIFSYPYPNGIVTSAIDTGFFTYRFSAIENPKMPIRISKKETIKIAYSNGNYFINHEYKHENYAVLPTDINSGKIVYTKVVDFKGATAKDLFNSADGLLQGMVKFTSVSSDRSDFTYQKYVGCFVTKYAGDPYNIYFNLIIRFKENKIKYEFTDFLAIFSKLKSKQSLNIIDAFANGTNSVTITNAKYLDVSYARGDRTSEVKKFWQPINDNIQQSIEMIINLCSMATPEKKDKW